VLGFFAFAIACCSTSAFLESVPVIVVDVCGFVTEILDWSKM
jgi:hypothetical protein